MASPVRAVIIPEVGDSIEVRFNPTQYSLDKSNHIAQQPVPGSPAPVTQWTRGDARTLSMELMFDSYADGLDVTAFTAPIYRLLDVKPGAHRPNVVKFVWGKFVFTCFLERAAGRFTLFRPDGTPVRATMNVTFREFIDPKAAAATPSPMESADHAKTRTVVRGDTLSSIAAAEYGDAGAWRPIAAANGLANPRYLEPARVLVIPPLRERSASA